MRDYRLTKRGKLVLASLNLLIFMAVIVSVKGIAIANDNISKQTGSIYLDKPISEVHNADIENTSVVKEKETVETGDNVTSENKEFLNINVEDIRSYEKGKLAFLTFDDGPSDKVTPEILTALDSYGIKATFFVLGNMCENNSDILVDLIERGHSIGIHSYSHKLEELLKSEENFVNELLLTENILKEHLGENFSTRLFRFPGGSFEDYKQQYMKVLNDYGYISVDWNALTGDTEYLNPTPEILMNRLQQTIINKDIIVVLMHDSDTKHITAEVLPDIIEYLISQGYEFATLK